MDIKEEKYCMILSKYRVIQGLALYYSLKKTTNRFRVYILCMDNEALEFINSMISENATSIPIKLLEDDYLCSLKKNRELDEYCWTLKPVFLEYLLKNFTDIKRITYLDADLFFYSEPNKIFEDIDEYSVLLSSHDFSRQYKPLERHCGRYNSGLISFRNNPEGIQCINWWRNRCYDLCSKKVRNNQFGDQKYLEQMPKKFKNFSLIKAQGVNIAPWNHSKYVFSSNGDAVYINKEKLVCYHFSGFRLLNNMEFSLSFGYEKKPDQAFYKPYLQMINQVIMDCHEKIPNYEGCFIEESSKKSAYLYKLAMFNNSM